MRLVSLLAVVFGPAARTAQAALLRIIGVKAEEDVFFGRDVVLHFPKRLTLGRRAAIGDNSHIACHAAITIGEDFLSGPGLFLNSGQHDVRSMEGFGAPISIGDRVWCGLRVTICAGVTIGDDVVIGAGAVVIQDLPSGCVAAGVPAKVVRKLCRGEAFTPNGAFG